MVKELNPARLHRSFRYAARGLWHALQNEANLRIHVAATALVVVTGALLRISGAEFAILLLAVGLVLTIEMVNTVIEDFLDVLHPQQHDAVRRIKDVLAGAVLLAAFVAVGVGILIFGPYLLATP